MRKLQFVLSTFFILTLSPQVGFSLPISGNSGLDGLGAFVGNFTYTVTNNTSAQIVVDLKNASPTANDGFITGFVFNNPSNWITNVTLSTTDADFFLMGGTSFTNTISAAPFGNFDIGAGLSASNFNGSGSPHLGIAVGSTESFTFNLTGTNLSGLDELAFLSLFTETTSDNSAAFLVRFRGFGDGGSDKVPGNPNDPIPEPTTMLLFGAGLAGLVGTKFREKK